MAGLLASQGTIGLQQRGEGPLAKGQLIATARGGQDGDRYVVKRPIRTADGQSRRANVIAIPAAVLSVT